MVSNHKINADCERHLGLGINKPIPRAIKPSIIEKKSQERSNGNGNNLLNHYREVNNQIIFNIIDLKNLKKM